MSTIVVDTLKPLDSELAIDTAVLVDFVATGTKNLADYSALRSYTGGMQVVNVTGDGIAGTFKKVSSTQSGYSDDNGVIIVATNGWVWKRVFASSVNLLWFGASTASGFDNTLALQRAVNYCTTNSKALFVPAGRYNFPNNSSTNFSIVSGDLVMFGEGKYASVFVYNDDVSTSRRDFFKGTCTNVGLYRMGFESSWGNDGTYSQRSQLVTITYTGGAVVQDCSFSKSRYMSLILTGGATAHVSACNLYRGVADGIRLTNVKRITVIGNHCESINDDSIAVHITDATPGPIDRSIVIQGNTLVDCQGITVLGAKQANISNNVIIRPHCRAIMVGCTDDSSGASVEGNTPPMNIKIQGNVISDLFRGSLFSTDTGTGLGWIVVRNIPPKPGGAPGYVGGINGSGGVVQPYDYLYINDIDAVGATNPGAWWIDVSGNSCVRTLKPVANYSLYGFGSRYGRSGPVDPAVVASDFTTVGKQILLMGQMHDTSVMNNTLHGGSVPVSLESASGAGYVAFRNTSVVRNKISNYSGNGGVYAGGDGLVIIDGNEIDGDPYNVHSARLANGKWNGTGYVTYSAVWLSATRAIIRGNTFRNVGSVFQGATPDRAFWEGNVIACKPTGPNYNANNIGVGDISAHARLGSTILVEDGDPASSTFNTTLNICLKAATAMPTTGTYVQGHIVHNSSPAVAGSAQAQYVVLGWMRITTGSSHTLDTDWRELRTLTGT